MLNRSHILVFAAFFAVIAPFCRAGGAGAAVGDPSARTHTVIVRPWQELLVHPRHNAAATVVSLNDSRLAVEVSGIIQAIPVRVGQRVATGDGLVRLDAWQQRRLLEQAEASLAETDAQLDMAQRQNRRAVELRREGQASEELLDRRQTELHRLRARQRQQRAALAAAREQLQKYRLQAPFAGVVAERFAQLGAWVAPGTPLLRLVDVDDLELSAPVDARQAVHLPDGRDWRFEQRGHRFPVVLRTLIPVADPVNRMREARFRFTGEKPLPGGSGSLVWRDPRPHLPPSVLVRRQGKLGVFLAEEGKAVFHPLPGAVEGRPARVGKLPAGDIVLSGREGLVDGSAIGARRMVGKNDLLPCRSGGGC